MKIKETSYKIGDKVLIQCLVEIHTINYGDGDQLIAKFKTPYIAITEKTIIKTPRFKFLCTDYEGNPQVTREYFPHSCSGKIVSDIDGAKTLIKPLEEFFCET